MATCLMVVVCAIAGALSSIPALRIYFTLTERRLEKLELRGGPSTGLTSGASYDDTALVRRLSRLEASASASVSASASASESP